jgi:hypothetical protein
MGWITRARDELQQAAAGRREVAARQGTAGGWTGRRNEAKRDGSAT